MYVLKRKSIKVYQDNCTIECWTIVHSKHVEVMEVQEGPVIGGKSKQVAARVIVLTYPVDSLMHVSKVETMFHVSKLSVTVEL